MNNHSESTTRIGLGFATQADAFQAGREAAQMARRQVPDGDPALVLVLGPGDVSLKDFIEGVRLVAGEETLVGVPVRRVITPDVSAPSACAVLIVRSNGTTFSLASADATGEHIMPVTTSLFSQIRRQRGNTHRSFDHRGLLLFNNTPASSQTSLAEEVAADAGLESWLLGSATLLDDHSALVCRNQTHERGAIAIECLSNAPWGIGTVSLSAFGDRADIHREAVGAALRAASHELQGGKPALGLLFFDFPLETFDENDILDLLECAISVVPQAPIIGIPTGSHFSRFGDQPVLSGRESVTALLVPQ